MAIRIPRHLEAEAAHIRHVLATEFRSSLRPRLRSYQEDDVIRWYVTDETGFSFHGPSSSSAAALGHVMQDAGWEVIEDSDGTVAGGMVVPAS